MAQKRSPRRNAASLPQDNDALVTAFSAYVAKVVGAAEQPKKGRPATDPNAFRHHLDCNLHTLAHESVQLETTQHFPIESGDRWQYVSKDHRRSFLCDLDDKGRVIFQAFDMEVLDRMSSTFGDVAEAIAFFGRGTRRPSASKLGDQEQAVRIGDETWPRLGDAKAHRAVAKAAGELARIGTGWAIVELYGIHIIPTRYSKRRAEARSSLESLAQSRDLSIEELFDDSIPSVLPAGTEERFAAIQSRRLERFMVDGTRFRFAQARSRFFLHAPALAIASRLVWGSAAKDGATSTWLWEDGGPHDVDGRSVTLPEDVAIGVLHPIELGQAQVKRWRQRLCEQRVTQPFLQIDRPLHTLTQAQKTSNIITDFRRYDRDWLAQQDWWGFKKDSDYMSDVDTFAVSMARDGQYIEAPLDGTGALAAIVMGKAKETSKAYEYAASTKATFGSLHPVSQSELLYALLGPRRGATPAPAGSSTGQQPFVEPAKSGRSTCVVCGEKIEKDTLRVAIEKDIDTPQFKGRGNVYVHAKQSCMTGCPELKDFQWNPKSR